MVEQIERVAAENEADAFGEARGLLEGEVGVGEARPVEGVAAEIAEAEGLRVEGASGGGRDADGAVDEGDVAAGQDWAATGRECAEQGGPDSGVAGEGGVGGDDVERVAGLDLRDVGQEPAFLGAVAMEGERPDAAEDEVVASVEVGAAVVSGGVGVVLDAACGEGVEVERLRKGVAGVELETTVQGLAGGDPEGVVVRHGRVGDLRDVAEGSAAAGDAGRRKGGIRANAGGRGGMGELVEVQRNAEVASAGANVAHLEDSVEAEVLLEVEVVAFGVGVAEVGVDRAGRQTADGGLGVERAHVEVAAGEEDRGGVGRIGGEAGDDALVGLIGEDAEAAADDGLALAGEVVGEADAGIVVEVLVVGLIDLLQGVGGGQEVDEAVRALGEGAVPLKAEA